MRIFTMRPLRLALAPAMLLVGSAVHAQSSPTKSDRFRMWAVKNSQKRRSACSEGEKSADGAKRRAGGESRAERSTGTRSGNMGARLRHLRCFACHGAFVSATTYR